jgi:hypothetical protein
VDECKIVPFVYIFALSMTFTILQKMSRASGPCVASCRSQESKAVSKQVSNCNCSAANGMVLFRGYPNKDSQLMISMTLIRSELEQQVQADSERSVNKSVAPKESLP